MKTWRNIMFKISRKLVLLFLSLISFNLNVIAADHFVDEQRQENDLNFLRESVHQIRLLSQFIKDRAGVEGVFRVPGNKVRLEEIIRLASSCYEENKPLPDYLDLFDVIGAYKKVISDAKFFEIIARNINEVIKANILNCQDLDHGQQNFVNYLDGLLFAGDLNQVYIAELIFDYFHLATFVAEKSGTNKMTSANMGLILAPFIQAIFGFDLFSDAPAKLSTHLISNQVFNEGFNQIYGHQAKQVKKNHLESIDKSIKDYQNGMQVLNDKINGKKSVLANVEKSLEKIERNKIATVNKKETKKALNNELQKVKVMIHDYEKMIQGAHAGVIRTKKLSLGIMQSVEEVAKYD